MRTLLILLSIVPSVVQACPTCYGTSVQYAPPFFSDELYQPTPATRQGAEKVAQRPAYTENYYRRGAPVMPRYGKRNSVGREQPDVVKEKHVQDLDAALPGQ